jgi:hypothetical protein
VTTTFATIGSGRRTRFFLRLARAMPERLRVSGVVTRDPGRADALTTDSGVPAFGTVGDLLRYERPYYIAAAVPWAAMPDAIREVVGHRMPVLAETPPAPDLPGLRTLWTDVGGTGLVQVAKQYLLMPGSFEETLGEQARALREQRPSRLGQVGQVDAGQPSTQCAAHAGHEHRLVQRPQRQAVLGRDEVQCATHEQGPHGRTALQQLDQLVRIERDEPAPQTDVRFHRLLRLQAHEVLSLVSCVNGSRVRSSVIASARTPVPSRFGLRSSSVRGRRLTQVGQRGE